MEEALKELAEMSGEELAELVSKLLDKKCNYQEDSIFIIEK